MVRKMVLMSKLSFNVVLIAVAIHILVAQSVQMLHDRVEMESGLRTGGILVNLLFDIYLIVHLTKIMSLKI